MRHGLVLGLVAILAGLGAGAPGARAQGGAPSGLDYGLYFLSDPRDAEECAMRAEQGRLLVDAAVTNPAITCPDLTAWKLFLEAVGQEFWRRWPADPQVWPAEPLPLCEEGASGPDCCTPGSLANPGYDDPENPARHCP